MHGVCGRWSGSAAGFGLGSVDAKRGEQHRGLLAGAWCPPSSASPSHFQEVSRHCSVGSAPVHALTQNVSHVPLSPSVSAGKSLAELNVWDGQGRKVARRSHQDAQRGRLVLAQDAIRSDTSIYALLVPWRSDRWISETGKEPKTVWLALKLDDAPYTEATVRPQTLKSRTLFATIHGTNTAAKSQNLKSRVS
jgi:hypothetical protein